MRTLWKRLTALFSRRQWNRELSEEVEIHLEMRAAELRQQGLDPTAEPRPAANSAASTRSKSSTATAAAFPGSRSWPRMRVTACAASAAIPL